MTLQTVVDAIQNFLAGMHIDEHLVLFVCFGVIIGMLLMRTGVHRRAYGYYQRYRRRW